jgi:hypothetical protein
VQGLKHNGVLLCLAACGRRQPSCTVSACQSSQPGFKSAHAAPLRRAWPRDRPGHMARRATWLRPRHSRSVDSAPGPGAASCCCCFCWRAGRQGAKRPGPVRARHPSRAPVAVARRSGPGPTAARRQRPGTRARRTPWARSPESRRSCPPRCSTTPAGGEGRGTELRGSQAGKASCCQEG